MHRGETKIVPRWPSLSSGRGAGQMNVPWDSNKRDGDCDTGKARAKTISSQRLGEMEGDRNRRLIVGDSVGVMEKQWRNCEIERKCSGKGLWHRLGEMEGDVNRGLIVGRFGLWRSNGGTSRLRGSVPAGDCGH